MENMLKLGNKWDNSGWGFIIRASWRYITQRCFTMHDLFDDSTDMFEIERINGLCMDGTVAICVSWQ
jgi:hypothetical protein